MQYIVTGKQTNQLKYCDETKKRAFNSELKKKKTAEPRLVQPLKSLGTDQQMKVLGQYRH